jgi:LmbE family N-acetylglucosaminyl deacetylase
VNPIDVLSKARTILVLGAHCDDIEIGCGGLLQRVVRSSPDAKIVLAVFSSSPVRSAETRAAIARLTGGGTVDLRIYEFRNGYFPYVGADIKDRFEALKTEFAPDLIVTHAMNDLHQDHRVLAELTWNSYRDHLILEYEIPKYDGGLGSPNLFLALERREVDLKVDTLMNCFVSQRDKQWFTSETFLGLMRLRGTECNSPSGYAEAFYVRKLSIW